jgi:hypothetical protein
MPHSLEGVLVCIILVFLDTADKLREAKQLSWSHSWQVAEYAILWNFGLGLSAFTVQGRSCVLS